MDCSRAMGGFASDRLGLFVKGAVVLNHMLLWPWRLVVPS